VLLFAVLGQQWVAQGAVHELMTFAPLAFAAGARVREGEVPAEALAVLLVFMSLLMQRENGRGAARALARLIVLRRRHPDMDPLPAALADLVIVGIADPGRLRAEFDRMRAADDVSTVLVAEIMLSNYLENEGATGEALQAAERAWELARRTGAEWFEAMAASSIAQLTGQLGRLEQTLEWMDRAVAGYERFGADEQQRQMLWLRGMTLASAGDLAAARTVFMQLRDGAGPTGEGRESAAIAAYGLAEVALAQGDRAAAADGFDEALAQFAQADQRSNPWHLMATAGALSAAVLNDIGTDGRRARWARRLRTQALAIIRLRSDSVDRPVLGTALIAWSAWTVHEDGRLDDGLAAFALAERLGARQDMPSLRRLAHEERLVALVGPERLAAQRQAASALTGAELVARARRILAAGARTTPSEA
jgi:tetratricopeptide (TPR) repeat protein